MGDVRIKSYGPRIVIIIVAVWLVLLGIGAAVLYAAKPYETKVQVTRDQTDTRDLEITINKPERTVTNPYTEVTVISNKEITADQNNRVTFKYLGRANGNYYYVAALGNLPLGETDTTIKLQDKVGNSKEQVIKVTRQNFAFPAGFKSVDPNPDATYVLDGDDLHATVDKTHRLLEDYEPDNLVDLNKDMGLYTYNDAHLRADAAQALKQMLNDLATATGKYVTIASGYRSYEDQISSLSTAIRQVGEEQALNLSARPGSSEHQLGTTVDFVSEDTGWDITNDFGNTTAGQWLSANCERYGFILPYKQDNSGAGGYLEESWHFRYEGKQS